MSCLHCYSWCPDCRQTVRCQCLRCKERQKAATIRAEARERCARDPALSLAQSWTEPQDPND